MELSEDSIKRKQNVLVCDKQEDSLEQHVNVQIKSELEECRLESNYTDNSLSDSYCSDDIKIEEHMLQDDIFPGMQEVEREIKQELDEHNVEVNHHRCEDLFHTPNTKKLDSERDVKLEIASTEIDHKKHCRSMKTAKLLSNIDTDTENFKMVRTYKRKTNRCDIDEDDIKKAVNDVRTGTYSCRQAASIYNIKITTLLYRLKKLKNRRGEAGDSGAEDDDDSQKFSSKYTSRQVFTNSEELLLVEYLQKCCNLNYGLNYRQVRSLAYEYALKNNKKMPKEWETNKLTGRDWILNFMKRHKNALSLRKPENTSLARIKGFNKQSVVEFYDNLEKVLTEHNFDPSRILNVDETGISTVLDQPKVIATLGQKQVGQVVSAERGSLITFVGIVTASGNSVPPVYIFPRVRMKDSFMRGTPVSSLGLCNKSGWITAELFLDVLKHIKKYLNPQPERGKNILLLLDNHHTHVTVSAVEFCRKNSRYVILSASYVQQTSTPRRWSVWRL
ncbi:uncharacterized protein LOC126881477 isoform X1 [Diabrotica virgifera virgifera]|uniref:HTH CENPB-type domain-containing protein n=1 Tax=Diabrotica virgifera virgifera TaxID=50390 RepID=A0ABM5JUV8_DIAVI|nr:uncharacterized protein LOC126881477 isoform X1 [Diabrotica virgifera virgifera]